MSAMQRSVRSTTVVVKWEGGVEGLVRTLLLTVIRIRRRGLLRVSPSDFLSCCTTGDMGVGVGCGASAAWAIRRRRGSPSIGALTTVLAPKSLQRPTQRVEHLRHLYLPPHPPLLLTSAVVVRRSSKPPPTIFCFSLLSRCFSRSCRTSTPIFAATSAAAADKALPRPSCSRYGLWFADHPNLREYLSG